MSGAIPPLPQYAFMAWCLVKAQGHSLLRSVALINFERFKCSTWNAFHLCLRDILTQQVILR
jgi:hypothetical protein